MSPSTGRAAALGLCDACPVWAVVVAASADMGPNAALTPAAARSPSCELNFHGARARSAELSAIVMAPLILSRGFV